MIDKKQHILDTAEKLFARYSYDATAVRAIADDAGVNLAMISYYFGSKENVLKSIIERYGSSLTTVIRDSADTSLNPLLRLQAIVRAYVEYSFDHPDPIIIFQREMGINNRPLLQDVIHCYYNEVKLILKNTIEEGQVSGQFRKTDISLFMFSMGGMTENVIKEIHSMELMGLDPCQFGVSGLNDPDFRERFFDLIWEIIETYLTKTVQYDGKKAEIGIPVHPARNPAGSPSKSEIV